MPLKHDTETVMVLLLGLSIALAGMVSAFLPPVTVSIVPWAIAFAISLVYPLVLYPMMKERRADYEFRALHVAPALILLVWLALDLLAVFRPQWQMLQLLFTWGWSIAIVAAACTLLVLFCLRVIRQRGVRLIALTAIFIPFLMLARLSGIHAWESRLAMALWDGVPSGTGGIAAHDGFSSNLAPSKDRKEEQWRAELRRMEQRRQQLANDRTSKPASLASVAGAQKSAMIASQGISGQTSSKKMIATTPPKLPSSGFGMEGIAVMFAAGYCTTLQWRWMKRGEV